ncbi:MAG: hypothetical protein BMS9Abin21_186 [Thermodesulfovibrionia bacterium]|nr:MAG: hypothetical protein BMS9Abin21_186 [Thermodesulfovibrionia bacterium]
MSEVTESQTDNIPKVRFDEVNGKLKDTKVQLESSQQALTSSQKEIDDLKGKLEDRKEPAPQRYTRAQLSAAVEAEQVTQLQADEFWDTQLRAELRSDILSEVSTLNEHTQRTQTVSSQVDNYREKVTGLMDDGSDNRKKVTSEFNYLVSIGYPNNQTTELAALRSAFGSAEKLNKETQARETHQETGGGEVNDIGENKVLKSLSNRQKDYYRKQIDKGIYKDWDEVKDELSYG